MEFNKVLDGIVRYMDKEIFPQMNGWQEMLARIAVSRFVGNAENIKTMLVENPFVRTFAIIDSNGHVDVTGLVSDIKQQMRARGGIEFTLPIFGSFKFNESDVDKLHLAIVNQ